MLWIGLPSPLGIPAFVIILSWSFKYAYSVLEHTQLGYATPPMLTFELWNPTQQRPLKQLFYLLLVFTISEYLDRFRSLVFTRTRAGIRKTGTTKTF